MREALVSLVALLTVGALVRQSTVPASPARALAAATGRSSESDQDCDIGLPLERGGAEGDRLLRALPASGAHGLSIGWQDGDAIFLRRFGRDCAAAGETIEVNRSQAFWERPGDSGLGDTAVLHNGATVVAWVLGGDVWFRVVSPSGSGGPPAVANGASSAPQGRAEVKVHPIRKGEVGANKAGFIVAWSSWGQDGDGWGVFVRRFLVDGEAASEEAQVNVYYQGFQWHPQLFSCGGGLWALWVNGSAVGQSTVLRRLAASGRSSTGWLMGPEVPLHTDGAGAALAATLACQGNGQDALAVGLARGPRNLLELGTQLVPSHVGGAAPNPPDAGAEAVAPGTPPVGDAALRSPSGGAAVAEPPRAAGPAPVGSGPQRLAEVVDRRLQGVGQGPGELSMLATGSPGLLLVLASDSAGALDEWLVTIGDGRDAIRDRYRRRAVGQGLRRVQAAWDVGGLRTALLLCWTADGAPGQGASLGCARHGLAWLTKEDLDLGSTLTFLAWCGLILSFCCARSCGALRGGGRRPEVSSTQARELRQQLAQIPAEPPARPAADAEPGAGAAPCAGGEVCAICQNDIVVRVAFRPCGHTACRDCVGRVADINQRCHICRASIEGVQPVYL